MSHPAALPPHDQPIDRRPIAARRLRIMHLAAAALARRRITPNIISIFGMLAAIAAAAALALASGTDTRSRILLLTAAALIQLRLLCNLLDGLVAVEGNMRSPLGELFNEVPDRISDMAILIGAGYALGSSPSLGWAAACLALFVAYTRAIGKSCGLPSDFRGPMAKQQRMFIVTVTSLYLALTPASWHPHFSLFTDTPRYGLMSLALAIIILGCIITALRRLARTAAALNRR